VARLPITSFSEALVSLYTETMAFAQGLSTGGLQEQSIDFINSKLVDFRASSKTILDKDALFAIKRDTIYTHKSGQTLRSDALYNRNLALVSTMAKIKEDGYREFV